MKKLFKLGSFIAFSTLIFGCTSKSLRDYANISNPEANLLGGLSSNVENIKLGDLYKSLREENQSFAFNMLIDLLIKQELDFVNEEVSTWYQREINDYMKTNFVDSTQFKNNGIFSENLLVDYLKSQLYEIDCESSSEILDETYFSCNYDDYINNYLKYEVYSNLLIEKYIIDQKENLLDVNEFRSIKYISISKDTSKGNYTTLDYMLSLVDDLLNNEVENIEAAGETLKAEKISKIEEEYEQVSNPDSYKYYELLEKYTKCGDNRCSIEEGYNYLKANVENEEYVMSDLLYKENSNLFNDTIQERLFLKDVSAKLVLIDGINYLSSPADKLKDDFVPSDAILFDSSSNKFYLIQVEIVNSQSSFELKTKAAKELINQVLKDEAISFYLNKYETSFHDQNLLDYITQTYTKYEIKD